MNRPRWTALGAALVLLAPASGAAQAPAARPGDEPRLLTADEQARRAKGSIFLGPPAGDKYGEAVPWSEVPEYKRASFFGVRSVARTVVFVVDCSGSMADDERLERAKAELRRSVRDLQFPQQFTVIFYNDAPIPMPGPALKSADLPTKDRFIGWLRLIEPVGETDPRGALGLAMGLHPDAIYLLSDGDFPEGTVEAVAASNRKKVPIHCIDLTAGAAGDHLRRISRDSGGQYAARH